MLKDPRKGIFAWVPKQAPARLRERIERYFYVSSAKREKYLAM
jgi:hypothetical protein